MCEEKNEEEKLARLECPTSMLGREKERE